MSEDQPVGTSLLVTTIVTYGPRTTTQTLSAAFWTASALFVRSIGVLGGQSCTEPAVVSAAIARFLWRVEKENGKPRGTSRSAPGHEDSHDVGVVFGFLPAWANRCHRHCRYRVAGPRTVRLFMSPQTDVMCFVSINLVARRRRRGDGGGDNRCDLPNANLRKAVLTAAF